MKDLTFIGIVGIYDPCRENSKNEIEKGLKA